MKSIPVISSLLPFKTQPMSSNFVWFALEMNRDHSVFFEIASKYFILDSFVDYDGYSISSKAFLTTVVDIMVI